MQDTTVRPLVTVLIEETGGSAFRLDNHRPLTGWALISGDQIWVWMAGVRPLQTATPGEPYTYEAWTADQRGQLHSLGALGPAAGGTMIAAFRSVCAAEAAGILVTAQARETLQPLAVVLAGRLTAAEPAPVTPNAAENQADWPSTPETPPVRPIPPAVPAAPALRQALPQLFPEQPAQRSIPLPQFVGGENYHEIPGEEGKAWEPASMDDVPLPRGTAVADETPTITEAPAAGEAPAVAAAPAAGEAPPVDAAPAAGEAPPVDAAPDLAEAPMPVVMPDHAPAADAAVAAVATVAATETPTAGVAAAHPGASAPLSGAERITVTMTPQPLLQGQGAAAAHLDPAQGGMLLTLRNLPGPDSLGQSPYTGRPYNAYRVWLQAAGGRTVHPVGLAGKVWTDTWRVHVREGLPLHKFDTITVTAEDRAGSSTNPQGPLLMVGQYA